MRKRTDSTYKEYEENDIYIMNDEEFFEPDMEIDDSDDGSVTSDTDEVHFKRSWRDIEKYREMRELYKIINDELYTGIYDEDFFEIEKYE